MEPPRGLTVLFLAALAATARCEGEAADQGKQLIMLEIERLNYPGEQGGMVKRQAVEYSNEQDQRQVPPEYLTLLQQLSPQDQQPRDIQQVYITRNPQETYTQYSRPPVPAPPPLTPEQEQMRRLQEAEANKHIREQQERALQRALQTGQFQTGFQPGPGPYQPQPQAPFQPQQPLRPSYQPQPQPQPQQYQQQPQPQFQYESSSSFGAGPEPQYSQPPSSSPFYQQTRSIRPAQVPKTFSYSQVQFGTSEITRDTLQPRLESIQQRLQTQAKAQPEYYSQEPQGPPQEEYRSPSQQQTPTLPQHPQQYLIETTRPAEQTEEPIVRIPRPRPAPQSLYYRPEPAPPSAPSSFYTKAPEQYSVPSNYQPPRQYPSAPQYVQRPEPETPSRSAYFVEQSGFTKRVSSQQAPAYNSFPAYSAGVPRIPTPQGHRPLTASEMKALSKAGFQISHLGLNSLQESSEISPSYDDEGDSDAYRSANSKRQSQYVDETKPPGKYPKRIPKPVHLTETERRLLAEQGIRNLYRVESAESKDSPVTYVLAIDSDVMMRQSQTERDSN